MKELSHQQSMRYHRHILLQDMDLAGQEALINSRVLLIGLGGLGCACAAYLVSSGVGTVTIVDFDEVDSSNLQRQILHTEAAVGLNKALSAQRQLQQLNSDCELVAITKKLNDSELEQAIQAHDLVVDCSDNLSTREQINQACFATQTPLVSGAAIRMEGQVSSFLMDNSGPCYQCLSQTFAEQSLTCVEAGIIAPLVGIVGSMQALEAIKIIAKIGDSLAGRLLLIDASSMEFRQFTLQKNPQCSVCQ